MWGLCQLLRISLPAVPSGEPDMDRPELKRPRPPDLQGPIWLGGPQEGLGLLEWVWVQGQSLGAPGNSHYSSSPAHSHLWAAAGPPGKAGRKTDSIQGCPGSVLKGPWPPLPSRSWVWKLAQAWGLTEWPWPSVLMIQVDVASLGLWLLPYPDKNPAGFHTSTRAEQLRPWVSAVRLPWPLPCPWWSCPPPCPPCLRQRVPPLGPCHPGAQCPCSLRFPSSVTTTPTTRSGWQRMQPSEDMVLGGAGAPHGCAPHSRAERVFWALPGGWAGLTRQTHSHIPCPQTFEQGR